MKKEVKTEINRDSIQDQVLKQIRDWQRSLADYLNLKCRHLSAKATLALLIIFSTLVSVALIRLIINAID
ncbi:MAG: hypothetical protein EOO45_04030 [Flavobacterium sp.]|nr:MAG: hypothetical protein EOO45_04030 [Flavobacterium sp.]